MTAIAIDTLRMSKRLAEAGFTGAQAEAVTALVTEASDPGIRELVTGKDLQIELAPLRADIGLLKWMVGANTALVLAVLVKLFTA
jgi:hypothetical protein